MYKFRVGVRNLGGSLGSFGSSGAKHACFLIDRDLFEYDSNGYKRHINKGRDNDYDWDSIGNALNGTTYVSPDRLQTAIDNSGDWSGREYNAFSYNCQDFVRFCLLAVGCPESMAYKKWSIYREQNGCVIF